MKSLLRIPEIIHIGFRSRTDTYTGQLGYIIYTDEKGVKRKETSWENWRDKSIDALTINNVPTSGFVLNKGVGGARQSYGWNARNEYIRVFDPRGFEFEISVANLLFILQESTSTRGKGLEGDFVYSWDKKDLVLLPVDCAEYKSSSKYTELQSEKLDKSMFIPGRVFEFKKTLTPFMYLGALECRTEPDYGHDCWPGILTYLENSKFKKRHVFQDMTTGNYRYDSGYTNYSRMISDVIDDTFADRYTAFHSSERMSNYHMFDLVQLKLDDIESKDNEYYYSARHFLIETNEDEFMTLNLPCSYYSTYRNPPSRSIKEPNDVLKHQTWENTICLPSGYSQLSPSTLLSLLDPVPAHRRYVAGKSPKQSFEIQESELPFIFKHFNVYTPVAILDSGKKIGVQNYVQPK